MKPVAAPLIERELPADEWMERAVLGHLLLENQAWSEAEVLVEEDFSLSSHRTMFGILRDAFTNDRQMDTRLLCNALRGPHALDEVGGASYVCDLTWGIVRSLPLGQYIRVMKEKAKLRRILAACDQAMTECYDQGVAAADVVKRLGVALKGIK